MAMALPETQKAIFQPDKMSTSVIMIHDHPVPTALPSTTEHLIRVHTTAITNGELLWAKYLSFPPESVVDKILVPCNDVAGTVITAPPSSPFQPGTEVYALSSFLRTGCARKYAILSTEEMARRPAKLSWAEAATVPMSSETAWQALFVHGGLEARAGEGAKGKRVFVTAASGGVGSLVVQLAKWAGAEVVASCGSRNVEWVRSLGADVVIDHTERDFRKWAEVVGEGKKVDLVVDCIGGKSLEGAWWVVKDDGILISVAQDPGKTRPTDMKGDIRNLFFIVKSNGDQLQKVTELIESSVMKKVPLDSVFPFGDFEEAFKKLESGKTRGKIVLDLTTD